MSSQPEASPTVTVFRRRRSRRHERNRRIRRALLLAVCAGTAIAFATVALTYLSPSLFRASTQGPRPDPMAAEAARNAIISAQQQSLQQMAKRPVYPYSVVAGGVQDAHELKWATDHDPVVAAHYAGFNYQRARVIQLLMTRSVYLSYRIGNRVYWTRKRVRLSKGEKLLTDGKMTARTRCANRVEEAPQQEASNLEPPAVKFDEPVLPALGTAAENPPVPMEAAMLNRSPVPGLGPAPPLGLYDPIQGGTLTPIAPPPLPGVCGVTIKKPEKGTEIATSAKDKTKKTIDPCASGSISEVPEPGTWLLVASGLSLMYWRFRNRFART